MLIYLVFVSLIGAEMSPAWLLVVVVVVGGAREAVGQCWEHPSCQDVNTESSMMVKKTYSGCFILLSL